LSWVRFLGALARRLWQLLAIVIIAYAAIVVIGRELLPVMDRYQPWINRYVSDRVGIEFRTESLGGNWSRLTPVLRGSGISIFGEAGPDRPAISIDRVSAELDLVSSVVNRQLVWRELDVGAVSVALVEDAGGHWTVGGLEMAGDSSGSLDGLMDVLFYSSHIRIDRVTVSLEFFSGVQTRIHSSDIQLENSDDFHRATASVALEENTAETARLILEGNGDPHDYENFDGIGYLQLKDVNFSGSLSALVRGWFPEMAERVGEIETNLDAEFWFHSVKQGVAKLTGRIEAAEIPLNWAVDLPPLKNFHTELTGWYRPGVDWGVRLQGADAEWADAEITPLNAAMVEKVGDRWTEFDLRVDHLKLEIVRGLLGTAGLLNDKLTEVLTTLNPRGNIHNLQLAVDVDPENPGLRLMANLDDVAIDSFHGAPAARGVSGYIQVEGPGGFVELDTESGFALHYPQAFDDFMVYDRARGRVDWLVDREQSRVLVQSGPITVDNGDGQGLAYLNLKIPTVPGDDPEMTLMVGLRDSHTRFRNHYIPGVLPPTLLHWLDSAIGDGDIPEAGFIWRGSLNMDHAQNRTLQVYARVENTDLAFQEGWLPLEAVAGSLTVDDGMTDVFIDSARLGEGRINAGTVKVRNSPSGNLLLLINADMTADAGAALDILRQSPLSDRVGLTQEWHLSGASRIHADLHIPLSAEDADSEAYRVRASLAQSRFALQDTDLMVTDIDGDLDFDLDNGLSAAKLRGHFLNGPVTASVSTDATATRVQFAGELALVNLGGYLGPLATRLTGSGKYRGQLAIPTAASEEPPTLKLNSDLVGVDLNLPAPFGKAADEVWKSWVELQFNDQSINLEANLSDRFATRMVLEEGQPLRGTLGLGITDVPVKAEPGLLVRGRLSELDTRVWRQLFENQAEQPGEVSILDRLSPRLDVRIAELIVEDFSVGNTRVRGRKGEAGWQLQVDSSVLAGQVFFDDDRSHPLTLRLEHLRLPQPEKTEAQPGLLETLDPRQVPALDFATKSLNLGDKDYGSLAFVTEPQADGLLVSHIQGTIEGVVIGEQQEDHPTLIRWLSDGDNNQTYVSATISTGDIADVLNLWDTPKIIDSKKAAFSVDMTWPDKPWKIQPAGLTGYLGLSLEKGNFYKSPGGATNALIKLVGLFNFDTWLRRLRFDFSDFFSSGVSYDQIRGGLAFREGIMSFEEPLQTIMTSGKIRMLGQADLLNEQIDARLVATMPVGTNLPWVAALVGGLPAAAGVYLTSKLFKKEVDKLSSISYRVTGSWDDPELRVDRIFSDKTDYSPSARPAIPQEEAAEPEAAAANEPEPDPESPAAPGADAGKGTGSDTATETVPESVPDAGSAAQAGPG